MKLLTNPKHSCIMEATAIEAELMCKRKGGLMIHGKDSIYALIQGHWIMILPPEESNTRSDGGELE